MTSDATEIISGNLRAEIARSRRNQSELTDIWHVSAMSVSRRLQGKTKVSAQELHAAADWLGVDIAVLLPQTVGAK